MKNISSHPYFKSNLCYLKSVLQQYYFRKQNKQNDGKKTCNLDMHLFDCALD